MPVDKVDKRFSKIRSENMVLSVPHSPFMSIMSAFLKATKHDFRGGHYGEDVWQHTMDVLSRIEKLNNGKVSERVKLAVLLHDIGKPLVVEQSGEKIKFIGHDKVGAKLADRILQQYAISDEERRKIVRLVRDHMKMNQALTEAKNGRYKALARLFADYLISGDRDLLPDLMLISIADARIDAPYAKLCRMIGTLPDDEEIKKMKDPKSRLVPLIRNKISEIYE